MTREEVAAMIQQIGTTDDDAQRRTLLTQLNDELTADYNSMSQLQADNDSLVTANEQLRAANMQLFQRVGAQTVGTQEQQQAQTTQELTYENLFKDGGLI